MSDDQDTLLFNSVKGTMHLIEHAHDWERLARDESLEDLVRVEAAQYGRAIREELRPC